jgi:hypothetical protein
MATSSPGYGAIPPANVGLPGAQGSNGQILTASGMNGSNWMMNQTITASTTNAIQIGNPDPVVTFGLDGNITTKSGTITAEDWISVIKIMKQLIMDMSQDEELASKYPYIRDAAHSWMIEKLRGE